MPKVLQPSGEQFEIVHGEQRATIVEVGGGIREYSVGGREVLDPYPLEAICDGAHGAPLIPWPNRLANGRYRFDGAELQLALSEPELHNAIHGLLRWRSWRASDRDGESVTMATQLHPLPGYPFALDVNIEYRLAEDGLTVSTSARNLGAGPCPYAAGQHPYLSPGAGLIDECRLELGAATRIMADGERKLPTGIEAVSGTSYDFNEARQLGDQQIDAPFTDLERDEQGRASVELTGPDGACVELWVDEHHPVIELYTGDDLAAERRRRGLGAEPMTCPPNALQSGEHVIRLEPGESVTTRWGVRLR
jgi:aldose 1-epimerase